MLRLAPFAMIMVLPHCGPDETISGYAGTRAIYVLEEIDGGSFGARATLSFPEKGRISGETPCNRYTGVQTAPYPWFGVERLAVTGADCPELADEVAFLEALGEMTLAEVLGEVLILSNDAGGEMVFRVAPPGTSGLD